MLFLVLSGEFDLAQLGLHVGIFNFGALDVRENLFGFLETAFRYQPTWAFWEPGHRCEDDDDEDELKGKGYSPSHTTWEVGEATKRLISSVGPDHRFRELTR